MCDCICFSAKFATVPWRFCGHAPHILPRADAALGRRFGGKMPCDIYLRPDAMDYDYGEPTTLCSETAPDSEVFVRDWTKSTVTVDCKAYTSKIVMKS